MSFFAPENLVAKNSWARLVDLFVDSLPLKELGFKHVDLREEGRPPYNPGLMLKLYMYGYKHGVRTSRKLEHACKVNVELWWLLEELKPSARAILYFRNENKKAFKQAFRYFVLVCKDWGLIDGDVIAVDSFKIRAQNSLKNNFNQKKIDRHKNYIDKKVEEYEKQLETEEEDENKHKIEDKISKHKAQKEKYEKIEEDLEQSGESQISLTDKDAKSVVLHRNIVNVGYNIQAASDSKYKLFVTNDTGDVNDTQALEAIASECKEILDKETMTVLADKGYNTGKQLQKCKDNNIITYVSPKESSSPNNGFFNIEVFKYNSKDDTIICPANQVLTTNGSYYKKNNYRVKHYKTKACKNCNIRNRCTKNKNGRLIERSEYQDVIEENKQRVESNPDYYRQRQQITEHQFGTLKRQWGFTFTLMKGKKNVLSEVNLYFLIYNLTRTMSILGQKELKRRLKTLFLYFSCWIGLIKDILETSNSFYVETNIYNNKIKYNLLALCRAEN